MNCNKILIAVDESENAARAVDYTGEMMRNGKPEAIMLLCIERFPERDLFPDEATWKQQCARRREELQGVLVKARATLEAKGVPPEVISERYAPSCDSPLGDEASPQCGAGPSIAREILKVLKEEGFGTLVVGRRGVSKAEEFLFGSVSNKIIHQAKACTVWVVA